MMARVLEAVAAANTGDVTIHAVGIEIPGWVQRYFLQALVDTSGGLLVEVRL